MHQMQACINRGLIASFSQDMLKVPFILLHLVGLPVLSVCKKDLSETTESWKILTYGHLVWKSLLHFQRFNNINAIDNFFLKNMRMKHVSRQSDIHSPRLHE